MPTAALAGERMRSLLLPYAPAEVLTPALIDQLSIFLDLLLYWRTKTNLTSIRDPSTIVERHFGESLFAACHLSPIGTLLDFGSGAGLPGIPIQLAHPQQRVTLAESQGKKAAFLFEATRTLGLATRVWPKRVEDLPAGTLFDVVAMRAVDQMEGSLQIAAGLARTLCVLSSVDALPEAGMTIPFHFRRIPVPNSVRRMLHIGSRHGTQGST